MNKYHGRLIENGVPAAGAKNLTFRIYVGPATVTALAAFETSGGGTADNEVHSSVPLGPGGVFQVAIGSPTIAAGGNGISTGVFTGAERWIEVQVGTEILTPRTRLVSVPYAYHADFSQNATTATFSTNSGTATFAVNAGTATFAQSATTASFLLGGAGGGAIPIGGILPYAGSAAPLGFFLCDGTVRPMGDAPALGALLLSTYGGDGTTTFGVPDLRGRFPLGVSDTDVLASTGGFRTHTLVTAELALHGHSTDGGGEHFHAVVREAGGGNQFVKAGDGGGRIDGVIDEGGTINNAPNLVKAWSDFGGISSAHNHGITPNGGNQPHNNMPPFQAINYIIKH